jgi:peroxiredoxin
VRLSETTVADEPSSPTSLEVRPPEDDGARLGERMSAYREESARRSPDFARAYDALVERLCGIDWSAAGPQVGQKLEDFTLPDANGRLVSLASLLRTGPVVVSLNRGHWCPYCRFDLRALAAVHPQIKALGAEVVSIMPDAAAYTRGYAERNALPFPLLSDMDNGYALSLGLVYWAGAELQRLYADAGIRLESYQRNDGYFLPMVAKFVVAPDGAIAARFVDVEFRKRTEPAEILAVLRGLRPG